MKTNFTIKGLCAALLLLASVAAGAATVSTNIAPITRIYSYESFGGGDVAIYHDTGIVGCEHGAWLAPGTPGFKNMMAMAMASYLSNKPVRFQIYDTELWSGSSANKLCKAYSIRFE